MGRGTLNLIANRKSRSSTFKKRKNNLLKKAYELSTLCDVRTCVLIHGPGSAPGEEQLPSEFHTWPPNRSDIEGMIRDYKNSSQKQKTFNLYDFFWDRKRKMEKKVSENTDPLECLSEHESREFMDRLDSKIEAATRMIDFLEADYDHLVSDQNDLQGGNLMNRPPLIVRDFRDLISSSNPNGCPSEYNFEDPQTGGNLNPPPLFEWDFPDLFSSATNPNGYQSEFDFEDLQFLLDHHNSTTQLINLMN